MHRAHYLRLQLLLELIIDGSHCWSPYVYNVMDGGFGGLLGFVGFYLEAIWWTSGFVYGLRLSLFKLIYYGPGSYTCSGFRRLYCL